MTMNRYVVSFTWSVLRLSSLCGLALALTGMTHTNVAKACYMCGSYGCFGACQYGGLYGSCLPAGYKGCYLSGTCK